MTDPTEALRGIWTPDSEVVELLIDLDPRTELDSMIRDWLHRVVEQKGPVTLQLGMPNDPKLNTGTLRWEIVNHQPRPGMPGRREISLWVEGAEHG